MICGNAAKLIKTHIRSSRNPKETRVSTFAIHTGRQTIALADDEKRSDAELSFVGDPMKPMAWVR